MKAKITATLIVVTFLVVACGAQPEPTSSPTEAVPGSPNPASVFCEEQGYQVEFREEEGGTKGYCVFGEGAECDEWAYYRGECAPPGETPEGEPTAQLANPASVFCEEQGYQVEFREEEGGTKGYCVFGEGAECEEWAYYRGECAPPGETPEGEPTAQLANPASENCVAQGGEWTIETRPVGGQYGVCLFEDNMQCEEWALLNGDCPVSGVKVTGYATQAGVYCAITGGEYAVTGNSGAADEQGTCTYPKSGITCDAWETLNDTCAALAHAGPTQLVVGGGAGQLVFDSTRDGDYRDLYQVESAGGGEVVRLTESETNNIAGPYSPDGTRIVYTTFGLTTSDIAVINADGTGQANLTNTPDVDEGFPDWSPDGAKIAFTTGRDGNNEIYVMDADGSNPTRLTDNPADDFAPSWSPDGTKIAFVSDREREPGMYDLYLMNADGSGVTRLTAEDPASKASYYSPDWSPDGTRIVYREQLPDVASEIFIVNADGSDPRNLTQSDSDEWAPAWSPDGEVIAFQSNADGNWEIYIMAIDASWNNNLTQNPGDDQMPFWRP